MKNKLISAILSVLLIFVSVAILSSANDLKLGDLDNNGVVAAADARLALRISAKLDTADEDTMKVADVDFSGTITAVDARLILRVAAHLDAFEEKSELDETASDDVTEEPTSEEPTTEEPTTEEPTTEEPTTEESTTEEPTTEEPTTEEPTTEEPTTEEPTTEEPTTEEPTTEEPTTEEPTTEEPTTEEPTTEEPTTKEPTTEPEPDSDAVTAKYPEEISIFLNGKFYMEGDIADAESEYPVVLATDGEQMEVQMNMDDMEFTLYTDGNALYFKYPYLDSTYYTDINDLLALVEDSDDFNIDYIIERFSFGTTEDFNDPVLTTQELGGVEYSVYTFVDDAGESLCFFLDENEDIKYIFTKNADGTIVSEIKLKTFTADIPSNMLTIKNCNEGNLLTLMAAYGV